VCDVTVMPVCMWFLNRKGVTHPSRVPVYSIVTKNRCISITAATRRFSENKSQGVRATYSCTTLGAMRRGARPNVVCIVRINPVLRLSLNLAYTDSDALSQIANTARGLLSFRPEAPRLAAAPIAWEKLAVIF